MKIGIITMHKVLNFGSALQAYALQRVLDNNGYDSEIIDYDFPPRSTTLDRLNTTVRFWIYATVFVWGINSFLASEIPLRTDATDLFASLTPSMISDK